MQVMENRTQTVILLLIVPGSALRLDTNLLEQRLWMHGLSRDVLRSIRQGDGKTRSPLYFSDIYYVQRHSTCGMLILLGFLGI